MLPGTDIPVPGGGVPYLPGEPGHLFRGHGHRRVVVRDDLAVQDGLLGYGLTQSRCVDEPVLDPVTLGDDGHDGEDVPVGIDIGTLFRLEADGVRQGLVTGHLVRGYIDEADRLRGRDDRCDLVVYGEQLQSRSGLLSSEQVTGSDA